MRKNISVTDERVAQILSKSTNASKLIQEAVLNYTTDTQTSNESGLTLEGLQTQITQLGYKMLQLLEILDQLDRNK